MSARSLVIAVCLCCWSSAVTGDEKKGPDLQAVVSASGDRYLKAFGERDAKKLAALFTKEAEYVDSTGTVFHGREAIEAELAASFKDDPEGTLTLEVSSIRPIAAGVVVEEGVSTFTPKGDGPTVQTRYAVTHVKQPDGNWLIASARELETMELSPHDHLKTLAWLEGRWREEDGQSVVSTEWKWSEDGNFLISEFSVRDEGEISLKGTHRLGWDGERKQFRSWIFDSTGGFSEGWWTAGEPGSWLVQLTGIDAAGTRRTSTISYVRDGADAILVSQEKRVHAGNSLPDISHKIVRQPPQPGSAKENKKGERGVSTP